MRFAKSPVFWVEAIDPGVDDINWEIRIGDVLAENGVDLPRPPDSIVPPWPFLEAEPGSQTHDCLPVLATR